MNKGLPYIIVTSLLTSAACTVVQDALPLETLVINAEQSMTKVSLSESRTVWNTGDELSVFWGGSSSAERWRYTGENGAVSGTLSPESGSPSHYDDEKFAVLYPWEDASSCSGDVIGTRLATVQPYAEGSFAYAVMAGVSAGREVSLKYACSFLRLDVRGCGRISSAVFRGNNGEAVSGAVNLDVSGDVPALTVSGTDKTVTLSFDTPAILSDTPQNLWFCLPPMTFDSGFSVTVTFASGAVATWYIYERISLVRGAVAVYDTFLADESEFLKISMDFSADDTAFTEKLPSSLTKYDSENGYDGGRVYYTKDGNFPVTFYTAGPSSSYGMMYYKTLGCLLFGRKGSWIKIPQVDGRVLYGVSFLAASTNGAPYIALDKDLKWRVSNSVQTIEAGSVYEMTLPSCKPGQDLYIGVTDGNLCVKELTFKYILEK